MWFISRNRKPKTEDTTPTNPHPGRGCDRTCDLADEAHDGGIWSLRTGRAVH